MRIASLLAVVAVLGLLALPAGAAVTTVFYDSFEDITSDEGWTQGNAGNPVVAVNTNPRTGGTGETTWSAMISAPASTRCDILRDIPTAAEDAIAANEQFTMEMYVWIPTGLAEGSSEIGLMPNKDTWEGAGANLLLPSYGWSWYDAVNHPGEVRLSDSQLGGWNHYWIPADAWVQLKVVHNLSETETRTIEGATQELGPRQAEIIIDGVSRGVRNISAGGYSDVPRKIGNYYGGLGSKGGLSSDYTLYVDEYTITTVPEPATLTILGVGLVGVLLRRRRK